MTQIESELTARLERLEAERRRCRRVRTAILFGVVAALLMGQGQPGSAPRVIEAERFVLRDGTGVARIELAVLPDGSPTLGFLDNAGVPRALLGLSPAGAPGLAFLDAAEKARLTLSVGAGGAAALALIDKAGRTRVTLDVATDGVPGLTFMDHEGRAQAALGIMPGGRLFTFPGGR